MEVVISLCRQIRGEKVTVLGGREMASRRNFDVSEEEE